MKYELCVQVLSTAASRAKASISQPSSEQTRAVRSGENGVSRNGKLFCVLIGAAGS